MKAFLYARVSTGEQDEAMQLEEMRELARRRKLEIQEFTDAGFSGAAARRPEFERMMKLVRRGKCDLVMVYRFDRFARTVHQLINALEEFRTLGVQLISVHEFIDTTTPAGKLMFVLIAGMAEFEREILRERTRSGMAHARAQGKPIGRPRSIVSMRKITRLRATGATWREVSEQVGASVSTLRKLRRINDSFEPKNAGLDSKGLTGRGNEA